MLILLPCGCFKKKKKNANTCFLFFFCIRDSSKKWQEKADLLTQLESQVKRMKENFDAKERLLLEERQKATEAHKYDSDSRGMNSLQKEENTNTRIPPEQNYHG